MAGAGVAVNRVFRLCRFDIPVCIYMHTHIYIYMSMVDDKGYIHRQDSIAMIDVHCMIPKLFVSESIRTSLGWTTKLNCWAEHASLSRLGL